MRWTVHGERPIYESEWMRLVLVDVEIPGGERFDHHVIRFPRQAAGTVVRDDERGVLLLWRHRFTTDTWGWEIPAGYVDSGETPDEAAAREVGEETGWRPGPLTRLGEFAPINGASDHTFHIFVADGATHVGDPLDWSESERIAWVPADRVRSLVLSGDVHDGLSLTGLLWAMAAGRL
jgi:8-oxo-dGTP pyrophosphatase MutT (NUDIX family)